MAGAKEIRTKIKSVKSTQKITRAMEMVAASKMRNVQLRMNHARPYANKIRQVIAHVGQAYSEYKHPYLVPREVKRVGFIVVSSDRGLCGGLNSNLFRAVVNATKELSANDIGVRYCVFGGKALAFFKRVGGRVLAEVSGLGDKPHLQQLIGPVKVMLDAYASGEIDKLVLVSNAFVNTMTQKPTLETLLPISHPVDTQQSSWDYIYEPGAPEVLGTLLDRYIESLVYQSVIENGACEQAARMVAMKAATENAGNLINELQLAYNKARQASITQEIAEIVGGAAAV